MALFVMLYQHWSQDLMRCAKLIEVTLVRAYKGSQDEGGDQGISQVSLVKKGSARDRTREEGMSLRIDIVEGVVVD